MNQIEAQRIANAISQLRPDWHPNGLMSILGDNRLRPRPAADVARIMVAVAVDIGSKKPGRVFESGPWWFAATPGGASEAIYKTPAYRVAASDDCDTCHGPKNGPHIDHDYVQLDSHKRAPMPDGLKKKIGRA